MLNCDYLNLDKSQFLNHVKLSLVGELIKPLPITFLMALHIEYPNLNVLDGTDKVKMLDMLKKR